MGILKSDKVHGLECENCEKTYSKRRDRINKPDFCCSECRSIFLKKIRMRTCKKCDNVFYPRLIQIAEGMGVYCSNRCHLQHAPPRKGGCVSEAQKDKAKATMVKNGTLMIGSKNKAWQGGRFINGGYVYININGVVHAEHRRVMSNYVGRELESNEIVHHKDGDKTNNSIDNLEIMTRTEHFLEHKKRGDIVNNKQVRGESVSTSKLTCDDVRYIRSSGLGRAELASKFCVTKENISSVINRKTWVHI